MSKRVLMFHYVLTNQHGEEIDSSAGNKPFPVMEGAGQIIPALETELFTMDVGDKKKVFLPVEKAYGVVNEELRIKMPRAKLPQGDIHVGTQFHSGDKESHMIFNVTAIEGDVISLDGNHPLAGQDLTFDVEIADIREATEEELTHGHAHGPDGHHH